MAQTTGFLAAEQFEGKLYSGGWVAGSERLETREPATGELLCEVGAADTAQVHEATRAAAAAQPAWAATDPLERMAILLRAAEVFEANHAEICDWLVREGGGVPFKAEAEFVGSIVELREAAALAPRARGELIPTVDGSLSSAVRVPVGVVGVIIPWNFPFALGMRSIAPALALGNAVVLKCDPNTPICGGFVFARAFEEAGLPDGLLHVLPGGAEAGAALTTAPDVGMVSFTGSTAAGRKVGASCGENLKHVSLELGGKNSFIVLEDADVDAAASNGALGAFMHQGQICMAVGRHLVHEKVADEYLEKLAASATNMPVGNPATDNVGLGPLINASQFEKVSSIVADSVAQGAEVRAGGEGQAPFFPATVLAAMTPEMRGWREEIFGPVAPVMTFSDDDEVIALANDTEYGLSTGIITGSVSRGRQIVSQLRTGMAHINGQTVNQDPRVPFGGMGASGNGSRFGGDANLDNFTQWRWITELAQPITFLY
ncbi:MAG TPA: aldehyde dehydrogenase family protein [Baekduia sp.]|nr:aldehyde dehydrogenase family protein [Baekduia sp.]